MAILAAFLATSVAPLEPLEHFFRSSARVPLDPLDGWDPSDPSGKHCIVIPTYPPHFRLVARFVATLRAFNTGVKHDLLVVLDSAAQARKFCEGLVGRPALRKASCGDVELTSLHELLRLSGEEMTAGPADIAAGHLGLPVPDNSFGQLGYLGALSGRRIVLSPRANLTTATNNWARRYQILKKWLGVVHARHTLGCALSWVVDSESLLFRPFNVTRMLERFARQPLLSVWPSTWPHERSARTEPGRHGDGRGGGGGGGGGLGGGGGGGALPSTSSTTTCWGLDPAQQRPSDGEPSAPSIMHVLLGISPARWPVAELCQFENLYYEDMWVYDAAIMEALLRRLRTIHFPRSLANLVLTFELGLQASFHYYAAWVLANRHAHLAAHPSSVYSRYRTADWVGELHEHHRPLYQKLVARGVFRRPPGGGNSETDRPGSGMRSAQLVVELLSSDDDAELSLSLRRVLPELLERSHWLNFVGWRDAFWPVLDDLCQHGWPGGVCLSNCPWSMAMAHACKPSAAGACTSACGVDFSAARDIEERFRGDDVSEKGWCHTPSLHTRLQCRGRRSKG